MSRLALTFAATVSLAVACNGHALTGPVPSAGVRTPPPPLATGAIAFVGVNVVPMDSARVIFDQTVLVRDGRIVAVGPRGEIEVPVDAERVPGEGRFLAPGLVDMHVHLRSDDVAAYLAAGITTVRNMWGTQEVEQLRAAAARGEAVPAIFSAGPGLDGNPPYWESSIVVEDPHAAARAVERQAQAGWDFIKVYNSLQPDVYEAIVLRARELGLAVVGHTPRLVGLERALETRQASIEHLSGYEVALGGRPGFAGWLALQPDGIESLARRTAESGAWICPTFVVVTALAERLEPAQQEIILENRRAVVRALREAGVPILAGTDSGIDIVPPGSSLANELEHLVAAGMTPYEALRAATFDAARFLALHHELGTVLVGMRADLVLLGGNPLEDVRNVRAPVGVLLRGRWMGST